MFLFYNDVKENMRDRVEMEFNDKKYIFLKIKCLLDNKRRGGFL